MRGHGLKIWLVFFEVILGHGLGVDFNGVTKIIADDALFDQSKGVQKCLVS